MNQDGGVMEQEEPFRIGGVVEDEFFTNREAEVGRLARALRTPQDHLVVFGPRRIGKTSIMRKAQETRRNAGQPVVLVDFSTASSLAEMATRLLQAATKELGRTWSDIAMSLVQRLKVRVTMEPDIASGFVLPSVSMEISEDEGVQRETLGNALDAIESLAQSKGKHVGLMIDEFQEIARFGGEVAEAHLRGIVQHHRHVTYILAGSDDRLIQAMMEPSRPFYKLLAPLEVGPIDAMHMSSWIEERLAIAGFSANGLGAIVVSAAGERTRDIVQLAQAVSNVAARGVQLDESAVEKAFASIVTASDAPYRALWASLSRLQQQLLRMLCIRSTGLTTAATRREFGITVASGSIVTGLNALIDRGLVVKRESRYAFDDPFMRGWVVMNALADIGKSRGVLVLPE